MGSTVTRPAELLFGWRLGRRSVRRDGRTLGAVLLVYKSTRARHGIAIIFSYMSILVGVCASVLEGISS